MFDEPGPPSPPLRIVILADVRMYRDGLADSLDRCEGFTVIGRAPVDGSGFDLVTQVAPDIVLLEAAAACSPAAMEAISACSVTVSFVAYGVAEEDSEALACAAAGAAGYVSREASLTELVETLRSVARHEFPCSPRVAALMLRHISQLTATQRGSPVSSPLTLREQEILSYLEDGLSNKDIARRLGIEISTVKNHVHHVLEKLRAQRRGQAAALARRLRSPALARTGMLRKI